VGISHPYLAILSVMVFIAVVTGVSFLYLHVVDQVNRAPVLGVYADAQIDPASRTITLRINIKHERGRPVEIVQALLYGEQQLVVMFGNDTCYVIGVNEAACNVLGLKGKALLPGGTGVVEVGLPMGSGYFVENKTYQGVVVFSEGSYPIAFTPVNIPRPLTTRQYPLTLIPVSPQETPSQQCAINRTSRGSIVFTDFESYPVPGWTSLGGSYSTGPGYTGNALYIVDNGAGVAGASQYYFNASLSSYPSLWVSVKVLGGGNNSNPNRQDYRHGVVLFDSSRANFYLVYVAYDPSGGDRDPLLAEPYYGLVIAKYYNRRWFLLSRTSSLPIKPDGWYTIVVNYMAVSDGLRIYAWLYDEDGNPVGGAGSYPLSYTDSSNYFNPAYVGVYAEDLGGRQAGADGAFDDMVISTVDPRYVYFAGLLPNTTVELWDLHYAKGLAFNATASGYALEVYVVRDVVIGTGGIVSINVSFPDGMTCTYSFPNVIGGDSYDVALTGAGEGAVSNTTVSAGIRAVLYINISRDSANPARIWALIVFNNSTETVYAKLVYDSSLSMVEKLTANVTFCNDVSLESCIVPALRIVQGNVVSDSTEWLELKQFSSAYLYLEGYLTSGTALLVLYIPACGGPVEVLEACSIYYIDIHLNPK